MADLSALRQQIDRRATFAVQDSAQRLRQTLQGTSPTRSNRMKLNTKVDARGNTAHVLVGVEYASYVREGTRSGYPITPKKGKYLAFFWPNDHRENPRKLPDGRALVQSVRHPGIKANPWYDDALAKWPDFLRDSLRRAPN